MVKGGYGQITDGLAQNLDVRKSVPVTSVFAKEDKVEVTVSSGKYFWLELVKNLCQTFISICKGLLHVSWEQTY